MSKRTAFYEHHVNAGAKMIDFGGFDMPVQYEGIRQEHAAVRESVGLFDVSHMGEVFVKGEEALDFINYITINDASKLVPGKAQYSAMCYPDGGIVDDLLVYKLQENNYLLVINASNIEKDVAWMKTHLKNFECTLTDESESYCLLAIQGPRSVDLVQKLTPADATSIGFYKFTIGEFCGFENVIISETGYTGEKGFEIYFNKNEADPDKIWTAIMEAGQEFDLTLCGLGARDTLRLEMGYALYGNDITKETHPLEAGLGWLTKLNKESFIGKEAISLAKESGITRKLSGFYTNEPRAIPRQGYDLCAKDGETVGFVTSGGMSITSGKGIGMGYIEKKYLDHEEQIWIQIRKKLVPAVISKPPFIKK